MTSFSSFNFLMQAQLSRSSASSALERSSGSQNSSTSTQRTNSLEYSKGDGVDNLSTENAGIHYLASFNRITEIIDLLKTCSNKSDLVNHRNNNRQSPLHIAADRGYTELATTLVTAGANLNVKDRRGMSPLGLAAQGGFIMTCKYLLSAGAEVNGDNDELSTPLHDLMDSGPPEPTLIEDYFQLLEMLVRTPNVVDATNVNGETPLHLACLRGNEAAVRFLLDRKAFVNASARNGESAIFFAVRMGHTSIAKLLVERKAELNMVGIQGTLYDVASRSPTPAEMFKILGASEHRVLIMPLENGPLGIPPRLRRWTDVISIACRNLNPRPAALSSSPSTQQQQQQSSPSSSPRGSPRSEQQQQQQTTDGKDNSPSITATSSSPTSLNDSPTIPGLLSSGTPARRLTFTALPLLHCSFSLHAPSAQSRTNSPRPPRHRSPSADFSDSGSSLASSDVSARSSASISGASEMGQLALSLLQQPHQHYQQQLASPPSDPQGTGELGLALVGSTTVPTAWQTRSVSDRPEQILYQSEVLHGTLNPKWETSGGVLQLSDPTMQTLTIRVWTHGDTRSGVLSDTNTKSNSAFRYFLDYTVNLADLGFIGSRLRNWPQNTLLFELKDGYYTTPEVIRFVQGGVRLMTNQTTGVSGSGISPSRSPSPTPPSAVGRSSTDGSRLGNATVYPKKGEKGSVVTPPSSLLLGTLRQQNVSSQKSAISSQLSFGSSNISNTSSQQYRSPPYLPQTMSGVGSYTPPYTIGSQPSTPPLKLAGGNTGSLGGVVVRVPSYSLAIIQLMVALRIREESTKEEASLLLSNTQSKTSAYRLLQLRKRESEQRRLNIERLKEEISDSIRLRDSIRSDVSSLRMRNAKLLRSVRNRICSSPPQEKKELIQSQVIAEQAKHASTVRNLELWSHSLVARLREVFPIAPLASNSSQWTICGIHLPHSDFLGSEEEKVAVALSHVGRVVTLLAEIYRLPLRYPLSLMGSRSLIRDDTAAQRMMTIAAFDAVVHVPVSNIRYPLYSNGVERKTFELGVYLLNKDIEQLMNVRGLPIADLRQILPNLSALLNAPLASQPSYGSGSGRRAAVISPQSSRGTTASSTSRPVLLSSNSTYASAEANSYANAFSPPPTSPPP